MFRQIMFTQLRWTRTLIAAMTVIAFLIPAIAWWMGGMRTVYPERPAAIITGFQSIGGLLVLLAGLGAFLVAAHPWMMDAASKHVLPLSLPIRWRQYLAMRFSAGVITLLLPAITLYLGSLFALSFIDLPPTLRAYPGTLALRFLAAALVAYSLTFALQYLAGRRAAAIILGILVAGLVVYGVFWVLGLSSLVDSFVSGLFEFPGPLAVFASDWTLVDV